MNKQELIEYLLLEMEKYNIHITCDDCFPKNAMVNIKRKLMIYNPTKISAFKIAHELSHVINKDICRGSENDTTNPQEVRANREAVLLLWEIFEANGGSYEYFNVFVDITESPFELAESIIKKEYLEMHEAITEIFEDELKVSINKQEMHEYIVDYISYFDVIESVNIYQFLDRYHLSHNFYNMAEIEFHQLFGTV
ncbi:MULTISPECIES: hypothetical protein [Lactococcus]|uniref:hypothetical protein n=1 Tax=Lactococcus TaxID=1357 RepID=UPI00143024FA|nr:MULTISPECIES: hypothetical protein [Lactococcus]KAF6609652.1 hypothetical protein HFD74_08380 [Lactococcus sp. EKM201L]KAF6613660.1 hypothetical protein HFD15_00815 [Lactococcus sp. EKM203L]KAF6640713.1 hypothetical protein HFC73_09155 [Lactococcus sp. EKM501L]KAF6645978.1 hypothetical protein HFC72_06315 [Lactococcus sp. EKM502L]KAF6651601.1 hypothetical protein HFC74_09770 [Lactococcus sp. EKM101L]